MVRESMKTGNKSEGPFFCRASLVVHIVKNPPVMQET